VAVAAGTEAMRGVRRAALLALLLVCAGCGQAGSSTPYVSPMTAGGGHDGGGQGGGGASGM